LLCSGRRRERCREESPERGVVERPLSGSGVRVRRFPDVEESRMVQRYVWWDDVKKTKRVRTEIHLPEPLHAFVKEVAKVHGVSVSSLIVGIVGYASDARDGRRLRVEVVPSVRVSELKPGADPVTVPVPAPSPADRKRWKRSNVL